MNTKDIKEKIEDLVLYKNKNKDDEQIVATCDMMIFQYIEILQIANAVPAQTLLGQTALDLSRNDIVVTLSTH